jgi:rubrerythrin
MACIEYFCRHCKFEWCGNNDKVCPVCGSDKLHLTFDEIVESSEEE